VNADLRWGVWYSLGVSKQIKYVVAVVLKNNQNPDEFLVVKRPDDDPDLGGHWGFPATSMNPGELPEDAAKRICKEKLNCEAEATRFLGIMFQKRNSYDIFLMDVDMLLIGQNQPDVHSANTENTAYVDQKWTTDPNDLMASAKGGSCCSSIFLTDRNLLDREEWINSLEGSDKVG
jgi:ADP-ribose pyrophosphatase YjhB (NUDIX family)